MLVTVKPPNFAAVHDAIEALMYDILDLMSNAPDYDTFYTTLYAKTRAHQRYVGLENKHGRHKGPIPEALESIFTQAAPVLPQERQAARDAFQADRHFFRKQPAFQFERHRSAPVHDQVKSWLKATYDKLFADRGFAELHKFKTMPRYATVDPFNREWLIEEVRKANPDLAACPYCGDTLNWGTRYSRVSQPKKPNKLRGVDVELDHFLPKDLYPTLSVSLWNLLPVCGTCNGRKLANDPLAANPRPDGVSELCLPYQGENLLTWIQPVFRWDSGFGLVVETGAKPTVARGELAKVQNFLRVTDVDTCWNGLVAGFRQEALKVVALRMRRKVEKKARGELRQMAEDRKCTVLFGQHAFLEWHLYQWMASQGEWQKTWNDMQLYFARKL